MIEETIVLSEDGAMKRIVPDDNGGFTLFKCYDGWVWDDSICAESAENIIKGGHKVFQIVKTEI